MAANAQVVVDDACQIIVACDVVIQTNDKATGRADGSAGAGQPGAGRHRASGRCPRRGAEDCQSGGQRLLSAPRRCRDWKLWGWTPISPRNGRSTIQALAAPQPEAVAGRLRRPQEKMQAKLQTARGRAVYGFAQGSGGAGVWADQRGRAAFRRFSLRGLEKIRSEWRLVCLTHNLLKIWRYRCTPSVN